MADRFADSLTALERGLESAVLRNQVIAHNIANVDTPGFQASEVPFGKVLEEEIARTSFQAKRTHEMHYAWEPAEDAGGIGVAKGNEKMRYDENTVDIEHEMNELARNVIYYNALTLKIGKQFSRMRLVLTEGG